MKLKADRLGWLIHRIKAMSPEEISVRAGRILLAPVERYAALRMRKDSYGEESLRQFPARNLPEPESFSRAPFVEPLSGGELIDVYDRMFPGRRQEAVDTGNRFLSEAPPVFTSGPAWEKGSPPTWLRDPASGGVWPQRFYSSYDPYDTAYGPPKDLWEYNRHQHLPALARAFRLSGDTSYADEISAQIEIWLDQNPPLTGMNWYSPMEPALRIISWVSVLHLLDPDGFPDPFLRMRLLRAIVLQAAFIAGRLSPDSSANNHLIAEAAGLVVAGAAFNREGAAADWFDKGLSVLDREALLQILPDGTPAEQAFGYAPFISDLFVVASAAAEQIGASLAPEAMNRLYMMSRFLTIMSGFPGGTPHVGDSDDARVIDFSGGKDDRFLASRVAVACLLGDPGLIPLDVLPDERAFWLLGPSRALSPEMRKPRDGRSDKAVEVTEGATKHFSGGGGAVSDTSTRDPSVCVDATTFPDGGYYILRNRKISVIMDAGPLGYGPLAAHGHADCLSIIVSAFGRRILDDPGTFRYHGDADLREVLRATAAHNTLTLDDRSQSIPAGLFIWTKKAEPGVVSLQQHGEIRWLTAEHNGYFPVVHRRTTLLVAGTFCVVSDSLRSVESPAGSGVMQGFVNWQFADGIELESYKRNTWIAGTDSGESLLLASFSSPATTAAEGEGRVSPSFGLALRAPRLRVGFDFNTEKVFSTHMLLVPIRNSGSIETPEIIRLDESSSDRQEVVFRFSADGKEWILTESDDSPGRSYSVRSGGTEWGFMEDETGCLMAVREDMER